jgi:hypothetical protein
MAKSKYKEEEDPKRPTPVRRDGAYVMMLFVTLVAIVGGTVLLYLDHEDYGSKSPQKEPEIKIKALGSKADLPDTGGAATPPTPPAPGPMGPGPMGPMPPMGMGPMGMP